MRVLDATRSAPSPGTPPEPAHVLAFARPLAVAGLVATVLGRAIGPSATGMGVGLYHVSRALEIAGDLTSLIVAMLAIAVAMALLLAFTRAPVAAPIKIGAIAVGGLAIVVTLVAAAIRVRGISTAIVGTTTAALAIVAAREAFRVPFARVAALVLGSIGAASLLRLAGVAVAEMASQPVSRAVVATARGIATAGFVLEVAALGLATMWITARARKVTTGGIVAALAVALLITRIVVAADPESLGMGAVLVKRGAERLLVRPDPFVPHAVRVFAVVLAPVLALVATFARGQVPALSAAVALALLVGAAPEMPLGALWLLVSSITLVMASHDSRGLWATLGAAPAGPDSRG